MVSLFITFGSELGWLTIFPFITGTRRTGIGFDTSTGIAFDMLTFVSARIRQIARTPRPPCCAAHRKTTLAAVVGHSSRLRMEQLQQQRSLCQEPSRTWELAG